MKKEEFTQLAKNKMFFLDGATGSNLIAHGMKSNQCPEMWILEHPEVLTELQKAYVEAGSNIVYAPTFTSNRIKLQEYGLADRIEEINTKLVSLSRQAVGGQALVAGDLTMTGLQLAPMGPMDFEELIQIYQEQIRYLVNAGVDLLVVETMMSLQETRAAVIAAKETCDLPIIATLTFEKDGRTLFGTDAETAAITLEALGVSAVGANCSSGPAAMAEIVRKMARVATIPIIAKPNAGMPKLNHDGTTGYDMDAEEFAQEMQLVADAGATILGGCCGTSPRYIELLHAQLQNVKVSVKSDLERFPKMHYLTSERSTLAFALDSPFMICGERINPTGKKALQAELREGRLELIHNFVSEQEECGAKLLDVNVGMSGINEQEKMIEVMETVLTDTNLPLSLDSSDVNVLEAALRRYPGKALVNSVSLEKIKVEQLLPIVKKYGASFILLPLDDKGLPENKEQKIDNINRLLDIALNMGFTKEDMIVDGLVTTVAANKRAAIETLETIEYCRQNGLATTCGLSNISFGLPDRGTVNAAFLTMAVQAGLTMAIANPSLELLTNAAYASDLLMAKENSDMIYIEKMNEKKEKEDAKNAALNADAQSVKAGANAVEADILTTIHQAVMKGKKDSILELTRGAYEQGRTPEQILNEALMPAINEVGALFERGKYFLPQLIASAEAMKKSIEFLEPLMIQDSSAEVKPGVVIATVEGDIHDIGKNLVALMLKNHGFVVYDLGKDVPAQQIVEKAIETKSSIIALSALMTTTMQRMRDVVKYKNKVAPALKVMIGGAAITPDYAQEIHADAYSKDAAEAVEVAKTLVNIR